MQQITQQLRSGQVRVTEVPAPGLSAGMLLVRNHFSLISAGTEGTTLKTARKSLIGKARERPAQVRQVLEVLKRQGPVQTYRTVIKKLDAYSPLGYSSAGEVLAVGEGVAGFAVGDRVACAGGGYANHAEIVAVPRNLCVKLPPDADLRAASYNTLGAIALQGVRQADLRLGESCAVIGLGLIGQLTCLLLRAAGVQVLGIDMDPQIVNLAAEHCCEAAWLRDAPGVVPQIAARTGGWGADAVIIAAGTPSTDPIELAGELARKKGRVVVVGNVPTGFERETYYRKELELRMSCSYGPGRYDLEYEEGGRDYPQAYVRWTENRNMQAFQALVHGGQVRLDYLTTHEFPLESAPRAYDLVLSRSEPYLGILLAYDVQTPPKRDGIRVGPSRPASGVGIAFIGAGSYAQSNLLPNLPRNDRHIVCRTVMTSSGTTARRVAERFGFEGCTSKIDQILDDDRVNTVFIATRHDSHAGYVEAALAAGKHVFVEKPLCLNERELERIVERLQASEGRQLTVGFNRRFAPLAATLKSALGEGPLAMTYRVNAGPIPADAWIQHAALGGGRIVGEVCHFIDFQTFLCGALPTAVHAVALPDPQGLNDTVSINLQFADGSIGTIAYFANGARSLEKEYVEVYQAGRTAILRDFRQLEIHGSGKVAKKKRFTQDKGQAAMIAAFLDRIRQGGPPLIPAEELIRVAQVVFAVRKSLETRQAFAVGNPGITG